MSQQIIVKPLGIITQPNKLGSIPVGALSKADQAWMRDPGTIEAAGTWVDFSPTGFGSQLGWLVQPSSTHVLWVFGTPASAYGYAWYDAAAGGSSLFSGAFQNSGFVSYEPSSAGRWSAIVFRARTLFLGNYGVLAWDYAVPANSTQAKPRTAGMIPAVWVGQLVVASATAGAMSADTCCHLVCVMRRKFADGYEIVSAPTAAIFITSVGAARDIPLQITVYSNHVAIGDIIEVYRTKSQPYAIGAPVNTGDDYFLSKTVTISAIASTYSFTDTAPDSGLGESLYTNLSASGKAASAYPPPTARCAAVFRGYAFYGNRVDPAQYKFRPAAFWGLMGRGATGASAYVRKNGIGTRTVAGSIVTGNATITGVSAADIVGIVVGQQYTGGFGYFPASTKVSAVGATTITMNLGATATGAFTDIDIEDTIEHELGVASAGSFSRYLSTGGYGSGFAQQLSRVFPDVSKIGTPPSVDTVPADYVVVTALTNFGSALSLSIRATNGAGYVPALPRIELAETTMTFTATTVLNGLSWSEENQPENCPAPNSAFVGKGEIYAFASTRDALWIFASDGLWRLSGTGGSVGAGFDWRIDPVDSTLSLSGPQALCVLRDTVYAYTNRGLVSVDSSGQVVTLSAGRLDDLLPGPTWSAPAWSSSTAMWLTANVSQDEVVMREPQASGGRIWVYNALTDCFTQDVTVPLIGTPPIHGIFNSGQSAVQVVYNYGGGTSVGLLVQNPSTTAAAAMDIKTQPVFSKNPFSMRRWQQINTAFEAPSGVTVTVTANNSIACGSRSITPAGNESVFSRTSFGVPVAAPCFANNIAVGISTAAIAGRVKLQGLALDFVEVTDQRSTR